MLTINDGTYSRDVRTAPGAWEPQSEVRTVEVRLSNERLSLRGFISTKEIIPQFDNTLV